MISPLIAWGCAAMKGPFRSVEVNKDNAALVDVTR